MLHGRKKIAVLHDFSDYTDGRAQAFRNLGHDVLEVPVNKHPHVARAIQAIEAFRPHFIFAHDYTMFEAGNSEARKWTRDFEAKIQFLNIPVIFYFLDAPERAGWPRFVDRLYQKDLLKNALYFVPAQKNVERLTELGYHSRRVGSGINSNLGQFFITNEKRKQFEADVSFVGSPNFDPQWLDLSPDHTPQFDSRDIKDIYAQSALQWLNFQAEDWFKEEPTPLAQCANQIQNLQADFQNFFAIEIQSPEDYIRARDRYFEEAFKKYSNSVARLARGTWNLLYNSYSSSQLVIGLKDLKESVPLSVWGGDAWRLFLGFDRPTPVIPRSDCYAVAASSKIFYCQTKHQLLDNLHERVAFSLAVGGFPITDWRDEIAEYFEPNEIVTYRSAEEAKDKIKYYLRHDEERKRIAARGRSKVLSVLTYENEMSRLLKMAGDHFGF